MNGRMISTSEMLYMNSPSEVIRSVAFKDPTNLKLSDTSTELTNSLKLVIGLFLSCVDDQRKITQRAPKLMTVILEGMMGSSEKDDTKEERQLCYNTIPT